MRIFNIVGTTIAAGAMSLLVGCSQELSQKDVNKTSEAANRAVVAADKKTEEIRHDANKEITDIDQARNDKASKLASDLKTTPAADAPKVEAEIGQTNRDAERKITEIRNNSVDKQQAAVQKAVETTDKAEQTAAAFEAQKNQKAFVDVRQHDLEQYDSAIVELKKRRDNLAGDAKVRFDQKMKTLDDKRAEAGKALSNLKSAKPEEWTTFRDETMTAFGGLKSAFTEAGQQPGI